MAIRMRAALVAALLPTCAWMNDAAAKEDAAPAVPRRPNVVFLAIDDQNDWIGCLGGHPLVKTPNIDKLAARGTVFTNAHCQMTLCNPSRTSLMLGLRPSTSGVYGLSPWFRTVETLADRVALPQEASV